MRTTVHPFSFGVKSNMGCNTGLHSLRLTTSTHKKEHSMSLLSYACHIVICGHHTTCKITITIMQLFTYVLNMVNNTASKGIYSLANTTDRYALQHTHNSNHSLPMKTGTMYCVMYCYKNLP